MAEESPDVPPSRDARSCLPLEIAAMVANLENAVEALSGARSSPLSGEAVHALAVIWHRLAAQVESARLAVLAAIDLRADVVPRARGSQAAAFGQHALGLGRGQAQREARDAALLVPLDADLRQLGSVYAEGAISRAHVEIATRTHRALGEAARSALVAAADLHRLAADLGPGAAELKALLTADGGGVRQIQVVDALLAYHARRLTVPEFDAVARRIVTHLNPPCDRRAHEQRFLHMSATFDGSWVGKFSCGAAQGAVLKAALSALSAPRPGVAIDGDGVEKPIPDDRDLGARQMDALLELVAAAVAAHGPRPAPSPAQNNGDDDGDDDCRDNSERDDNGAAGARDDGDRDRDRDDGGHPGVADTGSGSNAGRDDEPSAETLPERAASNEPGEPPGSRDSGEPPGSSTSGEPPGSRQTDEPSGSRKSDGRPASRELEEPPEPEGEFMVLRAPGVPAAPFPVVEMVLIVGIEHVAAARALRLGAVDAAVDPATGAGTGAGRARAGAGLAPATTPFAAGLTPFRRTASPPDLGAAGPVDDRTLDLLACSASVRAVVLAPNGGVLDLGRTQRLATAAQRRALRARDGGCVIPGCRVPADGCHAHHRIPWEDGGATDLANLVLVCARHHVDVHHGIWEIEMADGVPWVRPPSWVDRTRPLLLNAVHHLVGRQAGGPA